MGLFNRFIKFNSLDKSSGWTGNRGVIVSGSESGPQFYPTRVRRPQPFVRI